MDAEPDLAAVAGLIANRARAEMLNALFDGDTHSAGSLAALAGVAPSTASGHLDELVAGGLVVEERRGRQRHLRLAGPDVAHALEALSVIAPPVEPLPVGSKIAQLRAARTCYDHLAGTLGVALVEALVVRGVVDLSGAEYQLTAAGNRELLGLGVDVDGARASRRAFARACLDWSERRPHLGGALGAALARRLFELGWLSRVEGVRTVAVTPAGRRELQARFGLSTSAR